MNLILGAVTGTSYFNPGFAGQPILAGEGNTDSAAVSYTHLDVYKRQSIR